MQTTAPDNSQAILIEDKALPAAKLLQPHLTRHQRRQRWFMKELRKLQYTMARMRDIA